MNIVAVDGVPCRKTEGIICDRCGKDITMEFYKNGGNCTYCGEDLCADCAAGWNEFGECRKCSEEENNMTMPSSAARAKYTRKNQKRREKLCPQDVLYLRK
jgi:hypothetical protein